MNLLSNNVFLHAFTVSAACSASAAPEKSADTTGMYTGMVSIGEQQ